MFYSYDTKTRQQITQHFFFARWCIVINNNVICKKVDSVEQPNTP